MMHKTCSINYGHLADWQKTLPTTDLNKKQNKKQQLSFDKISPRDFYFFPFFSICTLVQLGMGVVAYFLSGKRREIQVIHQSSMRPLCQNRCKLVMTSLNGNIFRVTGPLCGGIHRSPVNSPHKGQWRGGLMFSLICAWTNAYVNNRDAGDLRRHHAHYDVIVMSMWFLWRPYHFPVSPWCRAS